MISRTMRSNLSREKILDMYRRGNPPEAGGKGTPMNVLIADDSARFRATLRRMLAARPGVGAIWEAENGEVAVRLIRAARPDLVLMDLAMPRMNGLEATRMIKARLPEVCVIICSVHNEPIYRRVASINGADGFLPKSSCVSGLNQVVQQAEEGRSCRGE